MDIHFDEGDFFWNLTRGWVYVRISCVEGVDKSLMIKNVISEQGDFDGKFTSLTAC